MLSSLSYSSSFKNRSLKSSLANKRIQRPNNNSRRVQNAQRNYLKYVPHEFSFLEAAKRFADADQKRLFAATYLDNKSLVIKEVPENPLKKVFIPIFRVKAEVEETSYRAEYGIHKIKTKIDSKGHFATEMHTNWYPISGNLGFHHYHEEENSMTIYGGLTWPASITENAFEGLTIDDRLIDFDPTHIDLNTFVDPFVKRTLLAEEIAKERIDSFELSLIRRDINSRVSCDVTSIRNYTVRYRSLKLSTYLLPGYVLQYLNQPPRIMSALKDQIRISGPGSLSVPKCMAVASAAAGIASLLFPQVGIPLRVGAIVASFALSGVFAQSKLYIQNHYHQYKIENERIMNERVSETHADKKRKEATQNFHVNQTSAPKVSENTHSLPREDLINLGIDPSLSNITIKVVQEAFFKKIKSIHPDTHKGKEFEEKTRNVINSRKRLMDILKKPKQ